MILNHVVEGAGRHVLLLHPVGLDLTFFEPLVTLLSPCYRVLRMDLRGHGRSPVTPLAQGFDEFAEDVHETLVAQALATIANAIPGATLKVISGAPHMLFIEQPQAVAQVLIAFPG
jgi:pimeloyl-ACP methyl ester carboxylesterase